MKLKRAKTYKKLMGYLQLNFNFREPYQVLVDEEILLDAISTKYDIVAGLERTLQGKVKPMITQCTMEHLYRAKTPEAKEAIKLAKTFERRRCGHITKEEVNTEAGETKKPAPKSAFECISDVIGPTNKHRYCIATQKPKLRQKFRQIPGVPLIYLSRSVMILEPMSTATKKTREAIEQAKLVSGLNAVGTPSISTTEPKGVHKARKVKGPNPLSVKKPQRLVQGSGDSESKSRRRKRGASNNVKSKDQPNNEGRQTSNEQINLEDQMRFEVAH